MRIKSTDHSSQSQAYLTRDPKDPLPNPHDGDKLQNGHIKNHGNGQRLESGPERDQNDNVPHLINGHSAVSYPTVIRNDHEMAVRTKVISVKRDIQPSKENHRAKPAIVPGSTLPTALHGTPQSQPVNGHSAQRAEAQHQRMPSSSDNSTSPTTPLSPTYFSSSNQGSIDSLDGPITRQSRHSSSGSVSLPYPVSPGPRSPNPFTMTSQARLTRQMSSYERTLPGGTDLDRLASELAQANVSSAPKFIKDTSAFWYKPDITREQALAILLDSHAGSFVVRDSRCFPGAFGLALKVDRLPPAVQQRSAVHPSDEYVRHFLIETTSKGVKLKGCPNEPVFGSLSALVYQHSITPLALPCKLIIPTKDQEVPPAEAQNGQNEALAAAELLKQGAACNVVYIGSLDTESLTGPMAIDNAITKAFSKASSNKTSIVHFKVSSQGITLTDKQRKIFFRRHYPTSTITFCGLDPQGGSNKAEPARRWDATDAKGTADAWMFGFVARKQTGSNDNECHVFAELDSTQPARAIVSFVTKILIGSNRQNSP